VMRAVREEMGVSGGVDGLPWLFTGTFTVTLALVPLFGIAAARLGRRALATAVYGAFAVSLVLLWLGFALVGDHELAIVWLSRVAFIWLSVINMIAVSTFWGVAVDLFGGERGKRTFGTLAAGGTAGALAGPSVALVLAERIGTHQLLLVSAAAWAMAMVCTRGLERASPPGARGEALGGSALAGLRDVAKNQTLREIGIYVLLYTATSTVIYIVQATIAKAAYESRDERTAFFASVDLAVNVLAIVVQLGGTRRMLERLRMATVLAILPVATIALLIVLGAWPTLATLAIVQTLRRALEHAVAKPGRELLYDRVDREAKLKGQNAVDTVVYRAGDAVSAWIVGGLQLIGIASTGLLFAFVPIAAVWAWYSRKIANR
ncbi:MAG TPA: MFS transporter, partial [Nannocystaceae bacterium]|nr:MFS transporter [Nannocystaceae bacterium]